VRKEFEQQEQCTIAVTRCKREELNMSSFSLSAVPLLSHDALT
jgi:hypothetical protein